MKVALVTGASRGIGAATAKELARLGYAVAINYRTNAELAESVKNEITQSGGVAACYKADISDHSEVEAMFSQIATDLGTIEVLVNNAGISYIGLLQDMSIQQVKKICDVDLFGTICCSLEAVKTMLGRNRGCIINISSMWGEVGASCETVYSACKAGIIGFTKALAKEVGPAGIRVNCVSPGVINTDMNAELDDETMRSLCEETPLLRIGSAEDVAKAVAFLVSDEASFVTGQVLSVNGGII